MSLFCKLFGHRPHEDPFWNNNSIDCCGRCGEQRAFYHTGDAYFTMLEWKGLIGYPIWFIGGKVVNFYCGAKFKMLNRNNQDDVPF